MFVMDNRARNNYALIKPIQDHRSNFGTLRCMYVNRIKKHFIVLGVIAQELYFLDVVGRSVNESILRSD